MTPSWRGHLRLSLVTCPVIPYNAISPAGEAAHSPFPGADAPRAKAGVHWARPELVAEIAFAGLTGSGAVRQASYKGLREDKSARAVRIEMAAAKQTSPAKSASLATVCGVALTHADKVLWPACGRETAITKRDLAHYLEAQADWMLRHLRGRPCSIIRGPDGVAGKVFFQRHGMKGAGEGVTEVKVAGEDKPYLQFDTAEALVAGAQMAALEFHPWNCQPDDPETPGRLVFDLDPAPDVPFARVIEAARELRDRLAEVGLESLCKTTGGKGLHVVTPLRRARGVAPGWAEAKAFALELCTQMAADAPGAYVVTMAKTARTGRIFLDYLRNDRTATAVAPLSPRARPGAPVSFPLTWTQVRAGLDPARFTLRTAPALLARSAAWEDHGDAQRPFAPAAKRLLAHRMR